MDKPTFVHFTDEWGSMYVNVATIIAMWPGSDPDKTCVQTTNTEKTYTVDGCLDDNMSKIGDAINIIE